MSDIIDDAAAQIELNEQRSIAYASIEANKPIPKVDNCLWCGMKTRNGARWCNRECCSHWERYGRQ